MPPALVGPQGAMNLESSGGLAVLARLRSAERLGAVVSPCASRRYIWGVLRLCSTRPRIVVPPQSRRRGPSHRTHATGPNDPPPVPPPGRVRTGTATFPAPSAIVGLRVVSIPRALEAVYFLSAHNTALRRSPRVVPMFTGPAKPSTVGWC